MRDHRVGTVAWVFGGLLAMLFMGLSIAHELDAFPGGGAALAAVVMPAVEAMRPLRWPAERLDTLGGYLTYHNIMLFSGFLELYAGIAGAKALRVWEERGAAEQVLATGWSRLALMRDRVLGFLIVLGLVSLGLGAGVALAMAVSGEPATADSMLTLAAVGLGAFTAYALGLCCAQFTRSANGGAGVTSLLLVVLYLTTNTWEQLGFVGALRYVSPFYYVNQSRALVPGHGFSLSASTTLVVLALALLAVGAVAFQRRDYAAPLWPRRAAHDGKKRAGGHVQGLTTRRPALAHLTQHRIALIGWTLGAAAFTALFVGLATTVLEAWAVFDYFTRLMGGGNGIDPKAQYASFVIDMLAPIVVAYAITQAAGWVADLREGRAEALLAGPCSWTRLVAERLVALLLGTGVIVLGCYAAMAAMAANVGLPLIAAGMARGFALLLLLALAMGALAAIAVAVFRSGIAVATLATYATAAYLLGWIVAVFEWPTWLNRFSVLSAFAHPYTAWPGGAELLVLGGLAVVGSALAALTAERTPKVA